MPTIGRKAHTSMLVAVALVLLTAVLAVQNAGAPGLLALAAVLREATQLVQAMAAASKEDGRPG